MQNIPTDQKRELFEHSFSSMLALLDDSQLLLQHKEEIFKVWYLSPFVKHVCLTQPRWLHNLFKHQALQTNYSKEKYIHLIESSIKQSITHEELQKQLRLLRTSEYARIAWRDIQNYTSVEQTLSELSCFADVCISKTLDWCFESEKQSVRNSEFLRMLPQNIIVFALGKLGGSELNFSSDVDLVFAYTSDDQLSQEDTSTAYTLYLKIIQRFIKILTEQTEDGFVFRVDTRLRPFGNSGTLLPSISAMDQYFQTHGRDWERYAWIKARVVAGNFSAGEKFLNDLIPFIYRRYMDYGSIESLREMKKLVDKKAMQTSAEQDIKIGKGGIREVEFSVQMFQLIYAGKDRRLRNKTTLGTLHILKEVGKLSIEKIEQLIDAYLFLRKVENGVQIYSDQQTHKLPKDQDKRSILSIFMNENSWTEFYNDYLNHTSQVNSIFQELLYEENAEGDEASKNNDLAGVWENLEEEPNCIRVLKDYFIDGENIYKNILDFSESGVVKQLTTFSKDRLDLFMPIFLRVVSKLDDPSLVIERFIKILKKIVQRSTYISLLIENQNKLFNLLQLIESSNWISQYITTHPILLDDLLQMEKNYEPPGLIELRRVLDVSLRYSEDNLETFMNSLREFKNSQVVQIAAADIVEDFPIMKVSDHLSWLAEVCIEKGVQLAYQNLCEKHGEPVCNNNSEEYIPELLVIQYGKLGGLELGYGSDLDIVFLHNSYGEKCETNGIKTIHNDVFFTRLVQRAIHILSTVTAAGKVFDIDTRLRPHGESGPIVTSINAYQHYLLNDAWLWEHQALIRARPITNNTELRDKFLDIRKKVLCQFREIQNVRNSVIEMREKILSEHGSKERDKFNIKKDRGGILDIEFIVQFYVLSYANKYNELCTYTDNVRILDTCSEVNLIEKNLVNELKEIYLQYRKLLHKLSLQLLPEVVDIHKFQQERDKVQHFWSSLLH